MKKLLFVSIPVILIVGFFALTVIADERLVRFEGGIGVHPVSRGDPNPNSASPSFVFAVERNVVRGVAPGNAPWVISTLKAQVKINGDIHARGEGLLHSGGERIGRTNTPPGGVISVAATLFCGPVPAVSSHSSAAFPLEPNGDFEIDDVLSPAPPDPCADPVLLIRANSDTGRWIAAGIPELD